MAVTSSLNKQTYVGNGTTKEFDFTFRVLSEEHIKLYLTNIDTEAVTEVTSNYEVAPTGGSFPADSGTVTYPVSGSALTSSYKITLYREVPLLQETEYPNNTALKPKVVETDLDRITMMIQQNAEAIARSIQLPITSDTSGEDILTEIYNVKAETQVYADNAASSADDSAASATQSANSATAAAASAAAAAASAISADWKNGGTITGNLTVTGVTTGSFIGSITGNAGTATKLATSRTINGVGFDGSANITVNPITIISEIQASGTAGGGFTSGAWRTRVLNTKNIDPIGVTLSSNQFTLPAGTYHLAAKCPANLVNYHKSQLQNITDGTSILVGTSEYASSSSGGYNSSFVNGVFTISSSKTFEIQHYCSTTRSADGFGYASSIAGASEVYTQVIITKVG